MSVPSQYLRNVLLFYPSGDEGFSPLFMAGIFMLLTHTTTLSRWSHSYFLREVKIIYYCGIYFSLMLMQRIRHMTPISILVIHNVKIRTLHKKHLLLLIQNLKCVCICPYTQAQVHRHIQVGIQKFRTKTEPIYTLWYQVITCMKKDLMGCWTHTF